MLRIGVRNHNEIAKKLSEVPYGARGKATESVAKVLIGNQATGLQHYPATRPGQVYARTYDLRWGWKVSAWGDGTAIRITNDVAYAPYVQGVGTQAWMHKGRWKTTAEVITSNSAAITSAINDSIRRFLKEKGLI